MVATEYVVGGEHILARRLTPVHDLRGDGILLRRHCPWSESCRQLTLRVGSAAEQQGRKYEPDVEVRCAHADTPFRPTEQRESKTPPLVSAMGRKRTFAAQYPWRKTARDRLTYDRISESR